MTQIPLPENRQLKIELSGDKLRLAIMQDGAEWVCRKESPRILHQFLEKDEASIFKGRLRLYKDNSTITIEVKNQPVGNIDARLFARTLQMISA